MGRQDLANLIEASIERLTVSWIEAVRSDARIQSDTDLSEEGLRDHIPAVVEEICDLLRSGETPTVINTREARVHAYVRFRQGYRARDLVRELSLLRLTLLDFLDSDLSNGADVAGIEPHAEASRMINMYIDEEMSYAVSVYVEAPKP
jgi:RsbRD-like negative regulator of sigma factor